MKLSFKARHIFAKGDMVVWKRQKWHQQTVAKYKKEYGKGPFQVMEVTENGLYCQCGKDNTKPYYEHSTGCYGNTGHPQQLVILTAQGRQEFSGSWFRKS